MHFTFVVLTILKSSDTLRTKQAVGILLSMADILTQYLLQVPIVTPEDLYAFHARVFGSPAPKQLVDTEQESSNDAAHEEVFEVDNDGLGYYPDGTKRTLTDDQIAMFRHSEIYSIWRERQVRKENLEAERGDQSGATVFHPEEAVEATASMDEGAVLSDVEVEEVFSTVPEPTSQHVEATQVKNKRKRGDIDIGYAHGKKHASRSTRGFVRELDSAVAGDQILDYGDEPSIAEASKHNEFAATEVEEQGTESQARRAEGKKIWWPILEAI